MEQVAKDGKSYNIYIICSKCPHPPCTKISNVVDELKVRLKDEWADLNHVVIERDGGEWELHLYALVFALEADVSST